MSLRPWLRKGRLLFKGVLYSSSGTERKPGKIRGGKGMAQASILTQRLKRSGAPGIVWAHHQFLLESWVEFYYWIKLHFLVTQRERILI